MTTTKRTTEATAALPQLERPRETRGLEAATVDPTKREVDCIMITEGPGNLRDRNYYTESFIKDAAIRYNGSRSYLNHQTSQERSSRPEGDIKHLAGFWKNTRAERVKRREDGKQVWAVKGTLVCDDSTAGREAFAKAQAQIEYAQIFPESQNEYCGLSINGSGRKGKTIMIDGQPWTEILGVGEADSVDVVTQPARGGAFLALLESAAAAAKTNPMEELDMTHKERIKLMGRLIEAQERAATEKDTKKLAEAKKEVKDLEAKLSEGRTSSSEMAHESGECEACKAAEGGKCEVHKEAEEESESEDEAKDKKGTKASEDEAEAESEDEDGEDEDESEDEAGAHGEPDGDEAPGDALKAIQQMVPRGAKEDEAAYGKRLAAIHAAVKGKESEAKKGKESRALTADELRQKFPQTFEAVAKKVRESLGTKQEDIKALKTRLREAETKLAIQESLAAAEVKLSEAKLSSRLLRPQDLVGMTEAEMDREIERVQEMVRMVTEGKTSAPRAPIPAGKGKVTTAQDGDAKLTEAAAGLRKKVLGR